MPAQEGPLSVVCYRFLLVVLPRRFRAEAGEQLIQVFTDEYRDLRRRGTRLGTARLWVTSILDLVATALAEHMIRIRRVFSGGKRSLLPSGPGRGGRHLVEDFIMDLRLAVRSLIKTPGFTLLAILILGLGIGANATIFTLANTLFFEPPPHVANPDELVRIFRTNEERSFAGSLSYPDYVHYRDHNSAFDGVLAYSSDPIALTVGTEEVRGSAEAWRVSYNYFDVLGVRPALGRWFTPEEGSTPGTHLVAVLSHGFWSRFFGRSQEVVGQTMTLNGHTFTIVGVAPQGFRGTGPLESPPDIWVPIMTQPVITPVDGDWLLERVEGSISHWVAVIARLGPGITPSAAESNLTAMASHLEETYPFWSEGMRVFLTTNVASNPSTRSLLMKMTWLLLAVVALVLLIATANVAILLLARASTRRKDIGVRLAIGAGRGRVVRQLLTESLVLSLLGGAAGFMISFWSAGAAGRFLPVNLALDLEPSVPVLVFALGMSLATAVLCGLLPAFQSSDLDVNEVLKGGRSDPRQHRARGVLVVAQVAMSLVLVMGSILFVRSLQSAHAVDLGFEMENRLVVAVNLRNHGYDEAERAREFQVRALDRLRALPGVRSAATARMTPFRGNWTSEVTPEGRPREEGSEMIAGMNSVSPDYFETMGIPLLEGRSFTRTEMVRQDDLAVINRKTAEEAWPGESPLGKYLYFRSGEEGVQVVGVVENGTYYELGEPPHTQVYLPGVLPFRVNFVLRTAGDPQSHIAAARDAVLGTDPNVAIIDAWPLERNFQREVGRFRTSASLVSLFGGLALLLALVGLYGVMSYLVVERTKEIGVRVAIGASRANVARVVLWRGIRLALIGTAVGLAGSLATVRLIESMLYGITPYDAGTFVAVPVLLLLATSAACLVPARRATRVDPMVALRSE